MISIESINWSEAQRKPGDRLHLDLRWLLAAPIDEDDHSESLNTWRKVTVGGRTYAWPPRVAIIGYGKAKHQALNPKPLHEASGEVVGLHLIP